MLVHDDGVAVGVHKDEAGRPRTVARFSDEGNTLFLQLALEIAHIGERLELLRVLIPARIKVREFFSNIPWKLSGKAPSCMSCSSLRNVPGQSFFRWYSRAG